MLAANQKAKASDPVGRQHSVFICTFSKEKKRKTKSVRATKGRRLCSQKVAISRKQTFFFFFSRLIQPSFRYPIYCFEFTESKWCKTMSFEEILKLEPGAATKEFAEFIFFMKWQIK